MDDRARILVVDDSATDRLILGNLLRDLGDVTYAESGTQALGLCTGDGFDLILLDVVMGDMDGFELCRHLKSEPRLVRTPVIFVTGLDTPASEEQGLSLGALDFITKPFTPAVVRARVRNYLDLARTQRNLIDANAELARLATIDPLTGLINRRQMEAAAQAEFSRAGRSGDALAVMLLDIDHFKSVNDRFGHAAGDAVLKTAGQTWRRLLRAGDLLARFGGEEFVALLPNTDERQACQLAGRLLTATRGLRVPCDAAAVTVTVSIGIAVRQPTGGDGFADLLKQADTALYEAKKKGRDTWVLGRTMLLCEGVA